MSRRACCCFPVRFCVFILSTLYLLITGVVAGFSWFVISQSTSHIGSLDIDKLHINGMDVALTSQQRTAYYVIGGVYTAAFLVSLFGLVGSIARKRGLVRAFFVLVLLHTVVSLGMGGYYLYILWSGHDSAFTDACQTLAAQGISCDTSDLKTLRIVTTSIMAISWLIQFWMLHTIHEYSQQLADEQAYVAVPTLGPNLYTGKYDDPYSHNAGYGFTTPNTGYKAA